MKMGVRSAGVSARNFLRDLSKATGRHAGVIALVVTPIAAVALIRYERPRELYSFLSNIATILGGIAILVGLWRYWRGEKDRRQAKHYQAWQVLNSAQGRGGNGGRIDALQDLAGDGVSLAGVNLDEAWLPHLALPPGTSLSNASLRKANLQDARLVEVNLADAWLDGADLSFAHLDRAILVDARLDGAVLAGARLTGANLTRARLTGANLAGVRLEWADLPDARLEGAHLALAWLDGARLTGAQLMGAQLEFARLMGAQLTGASFEGADLIGVSFAGAILNGAQLNGVKWDPKLINLEGANITDLKGAPRGFRKWALEHGAIEGGADEQSSEYIREYIKQRGPVG